MLFPFERNQGQTILSTKQNYFHLQLSNSISWWPCEVIRYSYWMKKQGLNLRFTICKCDSYRFNARNSMLPRLTFTKLPLCFTCFKVQNNFIYCNTNLIIVCIYFRLYNYLELHHTQFSGPEVFHWSQHVCFDITYYHLTRKTWAKQLQFPDLWLRIKLPLENCRKSIIH